MTQTDPTSQPNEIRETRFKITRRRIFIGAMVVMALAALGVLLYILLQPDGHLQLDCSFEDQPPHVQWAYGGELPMGLVSDAMDGTQAARLGAPAPQAEQGPGRSWLTQTVNIPGGGRPVLTFWYRMHVNDTIHYSDFRACLTNSQGDCLEEIRRDGFRSCDDDPIYDWAPPAGYDLGWRSASYDLSAFKGQTVQLMFENRNLWPASLGIWTDVDRVCVEDLGPQPTPPGPPRVYLPAVMNGYSECDPVVSVLGVAPMAYPGATPAPTRGPTPTPP